VKKSRKKEESDRLGETLKVVVDTSPPVQRAAFLKCAWRKKSEARREKGPRSTGETKWRVRTAKIKECIF